MEITVHKFDGGGSVWCEDGDSKMSVGIIEPGCHNYGIALRKEMISVIRGEGKVNGKPHFDPECDFITIERGEQISIEVDGTEPMYYLCMYGPKIFDWDFSRSVEELEISVRPYNALKSANIQTFGELVRKTEKEMLALENFGRKSLTEIKEALAYSDLKLGMTESDMLLWTIEKEKKRQRHQ